MTGGSRSIGAQTALPWLVPRFHTQSALDVSKDAILREHPTAKMLTFPTDVRYMKRVEEVVTALFVFYDDILCAVSTKRASERAGT